MGKSPIMKAVEKLLPQRYREAKTAADYGNVIADLDAQIAEATTVRDRIEDERPTVILNGEDPAEFSRRLFEASDLITTLGSNRDVAAEKARMLSAGEARAAFEARAVTTRDEAASGAEMALYELFAGLLASAEACEAYHQHTVKLGRINSESRNANRTDLVITKEAVRRNVIEELNASKADAPAIEEPAMPTRKPEKRLNQLQMQGEVTQLEGESDENFRARDETAWRDRLAVWQRQVDLRRQNAAATAAYRGKKEDPFAVAWKTVEALAFDICNPMSADERMANHRVVSSVPRQDGRVKIVATDGMPNRRMVVRGMSGGDAA